MVIAENLRKEGIEQGREQEMKCITELEKYID